MNDTFSSKVRSYATEAYVNQARRNGQRRFSIRVGDVHKNLHFQNRVPLVCNALKSKEFLRENDLRLIDVSGPRSGLSTTVTYTYEIGGEPKATGLAEHFMQFYGIGREVFAALGGGENFIRRERENFYGSPTEEHS